MKYQALFSQPPGKGHIQVEIVACAMDNNRFAQPVHTKSDQSIFLLLTLGFPGAQLTHSLITHFFSENTCELDIVLTRAVIILTTNELVKLTML